MTLDSSISKAERIKVLENGNLWALTRNKYIFVCGYCGKMDYPVKCGVCHSTNVKVYKLHETT